VVWDGRCFDLQEGNFARMEKESPEGLREHADLPEGQATSDVGKCTVGSATGCRICFEGERSGDLVSPCGCRGTQGLVHDSCLLRWRRLQVMQGKLAAAERCEICGSKYAANLEQPRRNLDALLFDFVRELIETLCGLGMFLSNGGAHPLGAFLIIVLSCFHLGRVAVFALLLLFPTLVLILYLNGMRLSILGTPGQQMRLGITSFGPPVEGLAKGMLLISIGAGGPFRQTVLYVIQHDDSGSLAVILNCTIKAKQTRSTGLTQSLRSGGPVQLPSFYCIHDIPGVPGSERLLRNESVFLSRNVRSLRMFDDVQESSRLVILKGISSWRDRQLEGEVRRGAWGWIKPEHVRPQDILEMGEVALGSCWERLLNSSHLEIFQG